MSDGLREGTRKSGGRAAPERRKGGLIDITARLEASRKELLDLGLRNPLISFSSRNRVDLVDERAVEAFRLLVEKQKGMTLQPIPEAMLADAAAAADPDAIDWRAVYAEADPNNDRRTDTKLQTRLDAEALTRRLLGMEADARTFIEEQGVNVLYLALGFIYLYEDTHATRERRTPLFMLPERLSRSSVREN